MNILVLNAGSSSLKYKLIDVRNESVILKGLVDGIGLPTCQVSYTIGNKHFLRKVVVKNHNQAVKFALATVADNKVDAIGHRVVHGGELYTDATLINTKVIKNIEKLFDLAPLHNPHNLAGIKACKKLMPKTPQVAVFDTAYHQTIPEEAYLYGIPYEYYKKYKIRKYGFHGASHKYVMLHAKALLKKVRVNLITCHLGNGASITAIKNNKSVDTTMGFTPLQGLIMGTRSGDVDPAIVAYLAEKEKKSADEIINILNKKSGLLGIDGYSDMRTVHEHAVKGDKRCKLAMEMFAYRIVEYIGAYVAVLGDVDGIVFTGGIGEGAFYLRTLIANKLSHLGVKIDSSKNRRHEQVISKRGSKLKLFVIPTDEELMIALETEKLISRR